MKKIETKEQKNKRKQRNQIIIGALMIVVLVLSTAGFALLSNEKTSPSDKNVQKVEVNGFEFQKQDNFWVSEINNKKQIFFFLPSELEDIEINITKSLQSYANKPLYIVNTLSATDQIYYNLYPEYILRINNACILEEECNDESSPQKSCEEDNIIIFKKSDEKTMIYQKQNCIYIEGDTTKGADKFLQKILKIA